MRFALGVAALTILVAAVVVSAQGQVTAVRAGKMFDPKSGANLTNQVVLIAGDKITDVGPADRVENLRRRKSDRSQQCDGASGID